MLVKKVNYTRLKALPRFENERVGIEIELENGDTHEDGLVVARRIVNEALGLGPTPSEIKKAKRLLKEAGEL